MKEITLKVDGMMCGMCEAHVNDAVRKAAEGKIKDVRSSHEKKQTVVVCEDDVTAETLAAAIKAQGYTVTGEEEKPYVKKGLFSFLKK